MPTGYTEGILNGKIATFPQFAKQCIRAFGAAIHMREEPMDAEITVRTPDKYYQKHIKEAKEALDSAKTLSDEDIVSNRKTELKKDRQYYIKKIAEVKGNVEKLNAILEDVNKWEPPTTEHFGIKEFMIQQITSTLDFDGQTDYHEKALAKIENKLSSLTPVEVRREMIEEAEKDLADSTLEYKKELDRCQTSNQWISDFLGSLP